MEEIAKLAALSFWFFLPGGIANMTPVLANKVPVINTWATPMDFGKSYRGRRIFGTNKRWRGLLVGTIMAAIMAFVQASLFAGGSSSQIIRAVCIGALMGLGALLGDAVESFFKRQLSIAPGQAWFPFDQIDYIIGGLLLSYPLARPSLKLMLCTLFLYLGLHMSTVFIGYKLRIRDSPI